MTVEIARMHKEDDQRRWLYAIVAAPLVLGSLAFLGGRVGRSISLTLVGWTAIGALVVARRRRAQNPPAGYQMPPAELMAHRRLDGCRRRPRRTRGRVVVPRGARA